MDDKCKYLEIYNLIKDLRVSILNNDTAANPFFIPILDEKTVSDMVDENNDPKYNNKLLDFSKTNNLPFELKAIHMYIGVDNRDLDINGITFFSFKGLVERFELLQSRGQKNLIDLGTKYLGLGHIAVLTLNRINNKVFFRCDGGSNSYDRANNFNKAITLDVNTIPDYKQVNLLELLKNPDIIELI